MIVEPYRLPVQILPVRVTSPTVNLYYPQVTGLRDIRIQQHMNQVIYQQFHSIIKQQGYYENLSLLANETVSSAGAALYKTNLHATKFFYLDNSFMIK
jgi:hypothetical protein